MDSLNDPSKCLANFMRAQASAEVRLDRINDRYVPSVIFGPSAIEELKAFDTSFLIASGSSWSRALGWRSFFGYPFSIKVDRNVPLVGKYIPNRYRFIAVGVENVCHHPTRGAYLQSVCFILRYPFTPELKESFLTWCDSFSDFKFNNSSSQAERIGKSIIRTKSHNPQEHLLWEGWVINQAKEEMVLGNDLYWRTLVFTDSHLDIPTVAKKNLIVISESIENMISESIQQRKLYNRWKRRRKIVIGEV
jgi:hypothetical protein